MHTDSMQFKYRINLNAGNHRGHFSFLLYNKNENVFYLY